MTGLLPDVIRDAVRAHSTYSASDSFGLVAVVAFLLLLVERQALALLGRSRFTSAALAAFAIPLFVAGALTVAARLEVILR